MLLTIMIYTLIRKRSFLLLKVMMTFTRLLCGKVEVILSYYKDLAVHFMIIKQYGMTLYGEEI